MQVFTARSCETYDIDYLCEELGRQIEENVTFGERTIGIAICDSTIDYRAVMKKLSQTYSFDIYGATALAFIRIMTEEDISVSFMVITGDEELVGSMALSEPLTPENRDLAIRETYNLARERLGEEPKMIISLQPFSLDVTPDDVVRVLDEVSGKCPIYGAVSSADLQSNVSGVFVNGVFYGDRLLINMLGGGIRPLFAVGRARLVVPHKRATIAESKGNVVRRVGEETFLAFMERNGLIIEPSYVLESFIASYTSSPVLVFDQNHPSGGRVLNIIHIDYDTGSVTLTGAAPRGSEVAICVLKREDVVASSIACFEEMVRKIEENTTEAYRYSTLFSTSCGGRYLLMSGDTSVEGDFITNSPAMKTLASCGFYAMGEICPTAVEDGVAENEAHHSSIALMAL